MLLGKEELNLARISKVAVTLNKLAIMKLADKAIFLVQFSLITLAIYTTKKGKKKGH